MRVGGSPPPSAEGARKRPPAPLLLPASSLLRLHPLGRWKGATKGPPPPLLKGHEKGEEDPASHPTAHAPPSSLSLSSLVFVSYRLLRRHHRTTNGLLFPFCLPPRHHLYLVSLFYHPSPSTSTNLHLHLSLPLSPFIPSISLGCCGCLKPTTFSHFCMAFIHLHLLSSLSSSSFIAENGCFRLSYHHRPSLLLPLLSLSSPIVTTFVFSHPPPSSTPVPLPLISLIFLNCRLQPPCLSSLPVFSLTTPPIVAKSPSSSVRQDPRTNSQ